MAEFAIVVVPLLILAVGIIDYGYSLMVKRRLSDMARNVARFSEFLYEHRVPGLDQCAALDALQDEYIPALIDAGLNLPLDYETRFRPPILESYGISEGGRNFSMAKVSLTQIRGGCLFCLNSLVPIFPDAHAEAVFRTNCQDPETTGGMVH